MHPKLEYQSKYSKGLLFIEMILMCQFHQTMRPTLEQEQSFFVQSFLSSFLFWRQQQQRKKRRNKRKAFKAIEPSQQTNLVDIVKEILLLTNPSFYPIYTLTSLISKRVIPNDILRPTLNNNWIDINTWKWWINFTIPLNFIVSSYFTKLELQS